MRAELPRCPTTDLERSGCGCRTCSQHRPTPAGTVIHIRDLEHVTGRPMHEYRARVRPIASTTASRRWQQTGLIDCDHDQRSTRLCSSCEVLLENLVGDIPALVEHLEEAMSRDVRFVSHGALAGAEDDPPLGLNLAASDTLRDLRDSLVYPDDAAKLAARIRPDRAAEVTTRQSRWMLMHWHDVLRHVNIRSIAHTLSQTVRRAHRVIDRPRDWMFLGACPNDCGAHLWAERDAERVACPNGACGWSGTVTDLVAGWLEAGDDRYLTERELLLAIPGLTRSSLRWWIDHEGLPRQEMTRPCWLEDGTLAPAKKFWTYQLGAVRKLRTAEMVTDQIMSTENVDTITTRELAERAEVKVSAIWKYVQRGVISPVRRAARPLRFTLDQVERLRQYKADRVSG